jgi:hypothetical protein
MSQPDGLVVPNGRTWQCLIGGTTVTAAAVIYKEPGQKVVKVYQANPSKSRVEVIALMEAKIRELGPTTVSKHCSTTHYVFDIAPSSIADHKKFVAAVSKNTSVSKFLQPPIDPAYHIEIPR